MNENRKEKTKWLSATPTNLNKRTNEKSRKTDRSISDESGQECTSLNGNGMYMRNRPNTMTRNPKEQIIELNKLMCGNLRISTPTNGSTSNKRHNVINERNLYVRVHRLLYQRYTKSRSHYLISNDKLFTPYPSLHIVKVGIIRMDKEVWIKLSNQSSQRGMLNIQKR